jgi:hypothetical protein
MRFKFRVKERQVATLRISTGREFQSLDLRSRRGKAREPMTVEVLG